MGASEKAVAAVMAACHVVPSTRRDRPHGLCEVHSKYLTDRGCPVAVAAADAAVDTDRPSIQAQALREAAGVFDRMGGRLTCVGVALRLKDLADRLEPQP
jgi:hypothetical protein